jgi:hypothetical protein
VFSRAGKTVTKIGIYSKPPQKTNFIAILSIIYSVNGFGMFFYFIWYLA